MCWIKNQNGLNISLRSIRSKECTLTIKQWFYFDIVSSFFFYFSNKCCLDRFTKFNPSSWKTITITMLWNKEYLSILNNDTIDRRTETKLRRWNLKGISIFVMTNNISHIYIIYDRFFLSISSSVFPLLIFHSIHPFVGLHVNIDAANDGELPI